MSKAEICSQCKMAHAPADGTLFLDFQPCLIAVEKALHDLVKHVGTRGVCRGCKADVWWIMHANGKATPYTAEGLNHFIDCPNAKDFKIG